MSKMERPSDRSGKRIREAAYVFIATVIVLSLIITALSIVPSSNGETYFEIASDQFIDYSISGKLDNVTVGGDVRVYFMERDDRGPRSFIVTLTERAPGDEIAPFSFDPLLVSRYFEYDGLNLTCIGDLLIYRLPQYSGSNGSGLSYGTFGESSDHQIVQTSYSNGETIHYINGNNDTVLEQWVPVGTGLPVKLKYSDAGGTDLTFLIWDSNIDWIDNLSR